MPRPVITLTTDFSADLFVGVMKGVIASINPEALVVDVTHAIRLGDVRAGAFAMRVSAGYFPKGTIHVGVVDPSVGSGRRIVCAQTADYVYLVPDNGLLSWRLEREKLLSVRSVENARFFLADVSRTFHGRDIFAPVAARLSLGVLPEDLGPEIDPEGLVRIQFPRPARLDERTLRGEVLYVDAFGNGITNLSAADFASADPARMRVETTSLCLTGLGRAYADAQPGTALALIGSAGFLEIAASGANAAKQFGLHVGDPVKVSFP